MTNPNPSVALIGAGAMGGALLKGWLGAGSIDPVRSAVFDPRPPDDIKDLCAARALPLNPDKESVSPDALVLAVKPQFAAAALPAYAPLSQNAVAISVMAGKSVAGIAAALGGAARIVRAMPNLPAAVGRGVSGLFASEGADEEDRALADHLMRAAGEAVWVDSEAQIDFVTAISGSGPAYFFLMTEALAQAGEALGLSKSAAAALARATCAGAGAMVEKDARSPAEMRKAVTSPGGTTEAALGVLDGDGAALRSLIKAAVAAAAARAGELTD